uniref:Symplekin n=1 Tax=Arion vulgaris TaxID=1028688 RepID=A0A0B7BJ07_9EUPU
MASTGGAGPSTSNSTSTANGGSSKLSGIMNRSTAANFFNKDEEPEKVKDPPSTTYDIVVDLLNTAAVMGKGADKIANLVKVRELIIHKSPDLLDNFMDEMLAYQSDTSKDVKKFIVAFMEEACKIDFECLPKVLPSIILLMGDDDVNVQKKVILTVSNLFKLTLAWINKAKTRPEMSLVWNRLNELKNLLYELLESVNDGIRTHVVKFLEGLTLVFSRKTTDSEPNKKNDIDMSLEQVPESNSIVKISQLEDEGKRAFNSLLQFQSSPHISSINLMTVMNALATIARQRPQFFDQVVQSFEALHVNLPPTLAKSQVSSVRKNLKTQMMSLLRHPASVDFIPQISTLLTDLGASQSEINKNTPKDSESRKRKAMESSASSSNKRMKPEIDDDDDGVTPWTDRTSRKSKMEPAQSKTAIDVTADDILPRLTPQNVTDLVLLSMVMLPDSMPAQFQSTYTPIAAAGTQTQISHIARLLSTQLTMAGMGKGLGELQLHAMKVDISSSISDQPSIPNQSIQTVVGLKTEEQEETQKKLKITQLPLPQTVKKIRQFQLSTVTKKLADKTMEAVNNQTMERILHAEKAASVGHVDHHRIKLLATLTTLFGQACKKNLREYIFNDLRSRQDLAFSWLYQEYAFCQGYSANLVGENTQPILGNYDECLTKLLVGLLDMDDHHGDSMFHRLVLEAPAITSNAIAVVKRYCTIPKHIEAGMKTLAQLINNRPSCRPKILELLLEFTSTDKSEVRNVAIKSVQSLHANGKMQVEIERYANLQLKKLLQPKPPGLAVKPEVTVGTPETWTEDLIKAHLYLHLGLLPTNHKLIHELANVYTATTADIKRTILRVLEVPVKGMGMDSPELLTLVENCPKGSETLVMRVIHILTDRAVPSPELVERIRDLYHKRVPDVRFLIPVLNGLSKNEVMEALPKLIKLNPMVVKEVFNRLMGSHVSSDSVYHSPLTPVELLVALHNIDSAKCDIKTTIKAANLCFSERNIYTQEVLAIVMQQLMDQDPLPTLLMRTVIQSLSMYPRLIGFVLNILQRLIIKKVWKQKKVWEGFIRCCQRAKPQSFQVLLQLPATQLKDVFEVCPDMREPLLVHVQGFTENQKSHINKAVMAVLEDVEMMAEMAETEKSDHVNTSKDRDKEEVHKIQSMPECPNQKMSTLTVVKTVENSPSVSESSKEKPSNIKISLHSSSKDGEKLERKRSHDREFSKERRKDDDRGRDEDRHDEDYSSRRSSKSTKRDGQDEEESKSSSSSRPKLSSSSSSSSSRRYTSSSNKKK